MESVRLRDLSSWLTIFACIFSVSWGLNLDFAFLVQALPYLSLQLAFLTEKAWALHPNTSEPVHLWEGSWNSDKLSGIAVGSWGYHWGTGWDGSLKSAQRKFVCAKKCFFSCWTRNCVHHFSILSCSVSASSSPELSQQTAPSSKHLLGLTYSPGYCPKCPTLSLLTNPFFCPWILITWV